jgi:hypothetical protein
VGAHPYWYFTNYEEDFDAALQDLRRREFEAGRYNPVVPYLQFPLGPASPSPGAQHGSIDDAREAADVHAEGTRSILDIERIGDAPDFCVACPLDDAVLEDLYETTKPTREMVEANMDFFEQIERGQAIYIVVYRNDRPDELLFAGYSYD